MSLTIPLHRLLSTPTYADKSVPKNLATYAELSQAGRSYVFVPNTESVGPDAYLEHGPTAWGGRTLTPLYRTSRARIEPKRERPRSFRGPDELALDIAEEVVRPQRPAVVVAGRTAPCCGRLQRLAMTRGDGRVLFDKAFSAYETPADAREPWPCADQHELGDGPFTRWADTVHSLLRYHHSAPVTSASSHTELRGREIRYSCLVVWGPQILRSVVGELAMAHGQTIKGRTIDVGWGLQDVRVLDLQAADLFWHEANETGVGYFAHLDAPSPAEECALVLDHARYLSKHPRLGLKEDPPERRPGFRIGPADSMVLPSTFGPEAPPQKKHDLPEQLDGAEKRRGGGLPRQPDPQKRRAVELHAEDVAIAYYQAQGWRVVERGRPGRPYDLLCVRGDETKHVEVKGLSGPPVNVRLTANERRHAQAFANIDLFVVHGIRVSNVYEASGDAFSVYENWTPQVEDLTPTEYQYRLPPA